MFTFAGVLHVPEKSCKPSYRPRMAEATSSSFVGSTTGTSVVSAKPSAQAKTKVLSHVSRYTNATPTKLDSITYPPLLANAVRQLANQALIWSALQQEQKAEMLRACKVAMKHCARCGKGRNTSVPTTRPGLDRAPVSTSTMCPRATVRVAYRTLCPSQPGPNSARESTMQKSWVPRPAPARSRVSRSATLILSPPLPLLITSRSLP
jgi:hypothetical protein